MNNELFDRMIKDNLQEMQVVPSAGVKKVLGWKLFFQNIMVFHKAKVAAGLLLATSATTYYFVTISGENDGITDSSFVSGLKEIDQDYDSEKTFLSEDKNGPSDNKNVIVYEEAGNANQNDNLIDHNFNSADEEPIAANISNEDIVDLAEKNSKNVDSQNETDADLDVKDVDFVKQKVGSQLEQHDENIDQEDNSIAADYSVQKLPFMQTSKVVGNPIDLQSSSSLTTPQDGPMPNIEVLPGVFKELSIDAYKGVMGKSEIESYLASSIHRQYHWDFHGNNDFLDMNVLGGFNVNYTIGARVFRIKASTGLSYYKLYDTKANYEFHEITDPAWLSFFQTDELAWVNTFGEDTCTQCFYAHNSEELQTELEQEKNQYSYLRIPVQLGTQFNMKYVIVDLMAGLDMNILTNARGLYVQEGLNPNYERFYYWDDLKLSTISKDNDMLKKSFASWSLAANVRFRVTKNFDILAGYQINKSIGSLTQDSYIMDKTLKSSNAIVGITFYPSRDRIKGNF